MFVPLVLADTHTVPRVEHISMPLESYSNKRENIK